jgi:hypothetical protein
LLLNPTTTPPLAIVLDPLTTGDSSSDSVRLGLAYV